MESFLKYLRGVAVAGIQRAPVVATTIAASVCEDGGGGDVDDDASFFDLEFAVPGDETSAASDAEEERVEFNFAVAGDDVASAAAEVVAVDDGGGESEKKKKNDDDGAAEEEAESEAEAALPPPASSSVPLRPATKFRVLLLKLRKSNKAAVPALLEGSAPAAAAKTTTTANRFLIKFGVDDAPLVSLFTRDNSSRTSDAGGDRPPAQQQQQVQDGVTAEERRFAKEVVLKYLNKIKPLYVKVSRRYGGERTRFPFPFPPKDRAEDGEETDAEADASSSSPAPAPSPAQQQQQQQPQPVVVTCGVRAPRASVPVGLKQVCKRLGKSRSASSAVAAAPAAPPVAVAAMAGGPVQRRDDSLLQDGIQSAIAHCKRSFNASKGCESPLLRSMTTVGGDGSRAADSSDGGDGA